MGNGKGKEGGKEKEKRGIWKVAFWNVAGVKRKDEEFWRGLTEWDVIVMSETWVEEKEWEAVARRLPKGYIWEKQWARRENKRGRAMGGMIMGVRKELEV